MSNQNTPPEWTPPGDAVGDETWPSRSDEREGTVAFSTEQTERISREDPPPPPPPPAVTHPGGWAPPPPPGSQPAYGAGGWEPPPTPRRTGLVVGIVAGVLGLVLVLGLAAVFVARTTLEEPAPAPGAEVERRQDRDGAADVPDDLQAQAEALLEVINASEERMIAFQEVVFTTLGEEGNVGDGAAEIAQAAQAAGDDLTALRSDLRALAGGDEEGFEGLRDVRDTYAEHMDAWIDYVDEVAGSPALASPDSPDAAPLWREIEVTGDDFVAAMQTGLPDDLPDDLQDLADLIIERGFGGSDGVTGEVV